MFHHECPRAPHHIAICRKHVDICGWNMTQVDGCNVEPDNAPSAVQIVQADGAHCAARSPGVRFYESPSFGLGRRLFAYPAIVRNNLVGSEYHRAGNTLSFSLYNWRVGQFG